MTGHSYKTTAIALQNRRLATVSKKGGQWGAEITDAGRYYLGHGKHPEPRSSPRLSASAALSDRLKEDARQPSRRRTSPGAGSTSTNHVTRSPMRYRIVVSRVQTAERFVRATDEDAAIKKVQEELDRPYGFLGGWQTVDTDMDVVEAQSSLPGSPQPIGNDGTALLSVKDAAAHLGIAYSRVYSLIGDGEIEHVAIGSRRYISRDGIKAFIEANSHRGVRYR